MHRFNSLKHIQHVDVHNSHLKKGKKEKKYFVYHFSEHVQQNKIFLKIDEIKVTNY